MKRRYGVVISAAVLALQLSGNATAQVAAPAIEELEAISALLDANDIEGLRSYLILHPELLQGESALARLLRDYIEQSEDIAAFVGVWEDAAGFSGDDDYSTLPFGDRETIAPGAGDTIVPIY